MKKIFLSTLALLSLCNFIFSQAPQLINYQAIAHDNNGDPITNKNITVRIGIISNAINGSLEWEEDHALTTNDYGLFSLKIGNGTSTNSGNQNSFANISWKNQIHFLNVQVDEGLGFEDLGTQQLVSVPYALFAKEAESVSNPTTSNLIDNQNGTFTYFNEIGLMTTFNANIDDADANPANELISSASLNNTSIEILEGTVTHSIDLNPLLGAINDSDWVIDNNNIYSAVSGNVGIGTTNPTVPLQIDYTGQVGLQVNGNNSSWNSIYMNGNTTSGGIGYGYLRNSVFRGGTYLNSSDDWNLRLWDGSATVSRIYVKHSNGNTGICNTNPSEKLHISNGSIRIDDGSNPYTLPFSDGIANQFLTTDGSGNLSWQTIANDGDWSISGNDLNSSVTGNVGIGPISGSPGFLTNNAKALTIATTDTYTATDPATLELVGSSTSANGISGRLSFGHITAGPTSIYEGSIEMNIGSSMIFNTDGANERMRINGSGNVGIGTSSPLSKLHVDGEIRVEGSNGAIHFRDQDGPSFYYYNYVDQDGFKIQYANGTSSFRINGANLYLGEGFFGGGTRLTVGNTGDGSYAIANSWQVFSDKRFKKEIKSISNPIKIIKSLDGVNYQWKSSNLKDIGFIAQEVEKVIPYIVNTNKETGFKSLDYSRITPILVEAIKEQQKMIDNLEKKINDLEKKQNKLTDKK